ncbi:hypothetical protein D8674_003413 [Pyrus ussuriensis x Pyrus communis]|uniref:Uncharacterized protein n=1 Tax=Pyrus ussuriensis x Pyrus communis TaxID=2448454 RepID=A0A5N5FH03_9ROSA|nr:hypothetical protein D8674_003413 [Pyrus ussuriensis x Pyrus communis]
MANSANGTSKGCEGEGYREKNAKITHTYGRRGNNDGRKQINLNDFRRSERESHTELAHEIRYVLWNKYPMAEWASWKKVSKDLKKSILDD